MVKIGETYFKRFFRICLTIFHHYARFFRICLTIFHHYARKYEWSVSCKALWRNLFLANAAIKLKQFHLPIFGPPAEPTVVLQIRSRPSVRDGHF